MESGENALTVYPLSHCHQRELMMTIPSSPSTPEDPAFPHSLPPPPAVPRLETGSRDSQADCVAGNVMTTTTTRQQQQHNDSMHTSIRDTRQEREMRRDVREVQQKQRKGNCDPVSDVDVEGRRSSRLSSHSMCERDSRLCIRGEGNDGGKREAERLRSTRFHHHCCKRREDQSVWPAVEARESSVRCTDWGSGREERMDFLRFFLTRVSSLSFAYFFFARLFFPALSQSSSSSSHLQPNMPFIPAVN